jgi:O-acetylserine/cysteine efflux transporter
VFAVLYLAFGATLLGYGTWSGLLAKYSANKVAPLSLLVPVTGLITAQIVLGEQLSGRQWTGGLVILLGLGIFNFGWMPIKKLFKTKGD